MILSSLFLKLVISIPTFSLLQLISRGFDIDRMPLVQITSTSMNLAYIRSYSGVTKDFQSKFNPPKKELLPVFATNIKTLNRAEAVA